tara:strand:+ start:333 stop:1370 length:1038 start_codon:yes stop_codon:yes gene_type:complete
MGNILSTSSSIKNNTIWKDKVAVITGGGQGMGAKMAEIFASRGIKGLALADINAEKLEETAGYIYQMLSEEERKHTLITTHIVDVSSREQVFAFAEDVIKIHKQCDCLLNNAGIVCANTTDNTTVEEWEKVVKVDLFSVFYCTKAFLPYLKASKQAYVGNTSSFAGIAGYPGESAYCTSKFGVRGFTECFMSECLTLTPNIHVSVIHPGMVKTDIFKNCDQYVHNVSDCVNSKTLGFELPDKYKMKSSSDLHWALNNIGSTTAREAAIQIVNGFENKSTRIIIGTDCQIVDYAMRLSPHFFLKNELIFKILSAFSFFTARFIGRKVISIVWLLGCYMWYRRGLRR